MKVRLLTAACVFVSRSILITALSLGEWRLQCNSAPSFRANASPPYASWPHPHLPTQNLAIAPTRGDTQRRASWSSCDCRLGAASSDDDLHETNSGESNQELHSSSLSSENERSSSNPCWQGSTYSWKPPPSKRKRDRHAPIRTVHLPHCGSVVIHQQADRLESKLDNPLSRYDGTQSTNHNNPNLKRTGVAIWSAALSMADYVDERCASGVWGDAHALHTRMCLELGAGVGLPSVVAACHGFTVVATESDPEALLLLKTNLRQTGGNVQTHILDWMDVENNPDAEEHHPAFMALEEYGGADLILLSDVVYGATQPAWGDLLSLLNRLRNQRQRRNDGSVVPTTTIAHEEIAIGKSLVRADGTRAYVRGNDDDDNDNDPLVLLGYTQRRRDMTPEEEGLFFVMVRGAGMEAWPIPYKLVPNAEERVLTTLFELRWT